MTHEVNGIGDVFKVKEYDYDTLKKLYDNGFREMREGKKEFPKEVAMMIMTAGYATDFLQAVKLSKKYQKANMPGGAVADIMQGIVMIVTAERSKTIFHTFDKNLLIKKLASYLFFDFYNTLADNLQGVYLDIDQRQIVVQYDDVENMCAIDAMRIARNIVNDALIIGPGDNNATMVNGEMVSEMICKEMEKKRPVNPKSYIFEE
jgi:hypothetical protein